MAKSMNALAPPVRDALRVLGQQLRFARQEHGWTAAELAQRAGVSPRTVLAAESGASGTAIGTVFHLARLVGVPLLGVDDPVELARMRRQGEERLAILPTRVHRSKAEPDARF